MRINDIIKKYMYLFIFIVIVGGLGVLSIRNLTKFYMNGEIDYNEWTPEMGSKFETDVSSTFYDKVNFINANGAVRNILGQPSMNGIIKLKNGYLASTLVYSPDQTLKTYADKLYDIQSYLDKRGTGLIYASTPYTVSKYDPELPDGIEDYGNDNVDRFVALLEEKDIDYIDFRETMHEEGIDQYDLMYKTDHHWTTEGGFYAYNLIEDRIKNKTGCKVDERNSDLDEYTITKYEKWHLGSNGQRTGIYYAGIDDFDLILPKFETCLKNDEGEIGSVEELMIDYRPLENKDYTSRYTYDRVLWNTMEHYVNINSENDVRVLLVSDSFGRAVCQYLATGFKEFRFVDSDNVAEITPDFIEEYDPDIVVMLYYPDKLCPGSIAFDFGG